MPLLLMLLLGFGLGRLFWGSGRGEAIGPHAGGTEPAGSQDPAVAPAAAEIAEIAAAARSAAPSAAAVDEPTAVRAEVPEEPSVPPGGRRLVGTVADVGGRPIEGATVRVVELANVRLFNRRPPDAAALASGPSASGVSDSEGRFSIEHELQFIVIEVAKEGYGTLLVERHQAPVGELERFDFRLSIAEPLAGLVVDSEGRGVASASLTARSLDPRNRPFVWAGTTDSIGAFALPGLTRGDYTIEVQCPGYVPLETRILSGRTDVRLVLTRSGVLTGRVRADSGPDRGRMWVTLTRPPANSGEPLVRETPLEERAFRLEGLAPGEYDVIVTVERLVPLRAGRVVIEPGIETSLPSLVFDAGYEVRGVIRDADGKPMAGMTAIARMPEARSNAVTLKSTATSAHDGSYVLEGVPAGAILILGAGKDHLCVEELRLEVVARREASIAPDLVMERVARVRGRTVDSAGSAMTGVEVILQGRTTEQRAVSGKDGQFEFDRVKSGEVSLFAVTSGGGRRSETVRCQLASGSEEELELTLR
ncbi:MAG: carboxypeptidase regulatory-like domain-containing protein [Planctomycetes bacterium]|nr:carboxypeptidase regulatory-like domain-containing protein [Planctomycetota bacterium]